MFSAYQFGWWAIKLSMSTKAITNFELRALCYSYCIVILEAHHQCHYCSIYKTHKSIILTTTTKSKQTTFVYDYRITMDSLIDLVGMTKSEPVYTDRSLSESQSSNDTVYINENNNIDNNKIFYNDQHTTPHNKYNKSNIRIDTLNNDFITNHTSSLLTLATAHELSEPVNQRTYSYTTTNASNKYKNNVKNIKRKRTSSTTYTFDKPKYSLSQPTETEYMHQQYHNTIKHKKMNQQQANTLLHIIDINNIHSCTIYELIYVPYTIPAKVLEVNNKPHAYTITCISIKLKDSEKYQRYVYAYDLSKLIAYNTHDSLDIFNNYSSPDEIVQLSDYINPYSITQYKINKTNNNMCYNHKSLTYLLTKQGIERFCDQYNETLAECLYDFIDDKLLPTLDESFEVEYA